MHGAQDDVVIGEGLHLLANLGVPEAFADLHTRENAKFISF
jgi:hypothetical protein